MDSGFSMAVLLDIYSSSITACFLPKCHQAVETRVPFDHFTVLAHLEMCIVVTCTLSTTGTDKEKKDETDFSLQ